MVIGDVTSCPHCCGELKYYDRTKRIVRGKYGKAKWIKIERFKCGKCGMVHRKLPNYIFPYKQYEADIIAGVLEGLITSEVLGYEDYPCEATMSAWRNARKLQRLL